MQKVSKKEGRGEVGQREEQKAKRSPLDPIALLPSLGGSNCRGKPRDSFPYGLNVLNTLNLGLASIWGVLILGTVPETILWWRVLFHLLL